MTWTKPDPYPQAGARVRAGQEPRYLRTFLCADCDVGWKEWVRPGEASICWACGTLLLADPLAI